MAVRDLMIGAMSSARSNFCLTRARLAANCLVDLIQFLNEDLGIVAAEGITKVEIPGFNGVAYEKRWPSTPNFSSSGRPEARRST